MKELMYSGKYANFDMIQGDTFEFGIKIHNLSEKPDIVSFGIKKKLDNKNYTFRVELGKGINFIKQEAGENYIYKIRVGPQETDISLGKYFYEIIYGYIQSGEIYTALKGILNVKSPFHKKDEGLESNDLPLINYKEITKGSTYNQSITFVDLDQELDGMFFMMKKNLDIEEPEITLTLQDGISLEKIDGKNYTYTYQLSAEKTLNLPLGEYYYSVQIYANGDIKTIETGIIFITFNV